MIKKINEQHIVENEPHNGGCFLIMTWILILVFAGMVGVMIFRAIKSTL